MQICPLSWAGVVTATHFAPVDEQLSIALSFTRFKNEHLQAADTLSNIPAIFSEVQVPVTISQSGKPGLIKERHRDVCTGMNESQPPPPDNPARHGFALEDFPSLMPESACGTTGEHSDISPILPNGNGDSATLIPVSKLKFEISVLLEKEQGQKETAIIYLGQSGFNKISSPGSEWLSLENLIPLVMSQLDGERAHQDIVNTLQDSLDAILPSSNSDKPGYWFAPESVCNQLDDLFELQGQGYGYELKIQVMKYPLDHFFLPRSKGSHGYKPGNIADHNTGEEHDESCSESADSLSTASTINGHEREISFSSPRGDEKDISMVKKHTQPDSSESGYGSLPSTSWGACELCNTPEVAPSLRRCYSCLENDLETSLLRLEEGVEQTLQALESGREHTYGEGMLEIWLAALRQNRHQFVTTQEVRWAITLIDRICQMVKSGKATPDVQIIEWWLKNLRDLNHSQYGRLKELYETALSERESEGTEEQTAYFYDRRIISWLGILCRYSRLIIVSDDDRCVTHLENVFQTVGRGRTHTDESKVNSWLCQIRKKNPALCDELNISWAAARIKRMLPAIESGDLSPIDGKEFIGCLHLIRYTHPDLHHVFNTRWSAAQLKRRLPIIKSTGLPIDEKEVNGWLNLIRYTHPDLYHEFDNCRTAARLKRMLPAIENADLPIDKKEVNCYLSRIRDSHPGLHREFNTHWAAARLKRMLPVIESTDLPINDGEVNGCLNLIRYTHPDLHREFNTRLAVTRLEQALQMAESGKTFIDESCIKGWLNLLRIGRCPELHRFNWRWDAVKLERVTQVAESGKTHSDESKVGGWLTVVNKYHPSLCDEFNMRWAVVNLERGLQAVESNKPLPDKIKINRWLNTVRQKNSALHCKLSVRWAAVQTEQVLQAVESNKTHDDEDEVKGWLVLLKKNDHPESNGFSLRWDAVRLKRALLAAERDQTLPASGKIRGWLHLLLLNHHPEYDKLSLQWDVVRLKQVLQALESNKCHSDENQIAGWLNVLKKNHHPEYDEFNMRWSLIRRNNVFQAGESNGHHPDENQVEGWLCTLQKKHPVLHNRLSMRWDTIQFEREIRAAETSKSRPGKKQVNYWMRNLERLCPPDNPWLKFRCHQLRLEAERTEGETYNDQILRIHKRPGSYRRK